MEIIRTNSSSREFVDLTFQLDSELNDRYGLKQSKYNKYNKLDPIDTVFIGYFDKIPVACGCFKEIAPQTIEIKRMYVRKDYRRKGFSIKILQYLEKLGFELGYSKAKLETGKRQPEAIALYKKCGYKIIENYGPYVDFENSVCMEKLLSGS